MANRTLSIRLTCCQFTRRYPVAALLILLSAGIGHGTPDLATSRPPGQEDPCAVKELKKSGIQGLVVYSSDRRRYLVNKEDQTGVAQIYIGVNGSADLKCLTCSAVPGGPNPNRFKMQPHWHPSGRWIFLAVEREKYSKPPLLGLSKAYVEGLLQCGLWTDMYAVSPDGLKWFRLTNFKSGISGVPDGFTGPAFTPDGRIAAWSQIVDGNIFKFWPFGRWQLILAEFEEIDGKPSFARLRDVTPAGMNWNEPGNFHPDSETLLLTGSVERDAQGMDQYLLNVRTGVLTNLTRSPTVWDEHGLFSPDGRKILFMSAYPYRADANASKTLQLKSEFMLMNIDGSSLRQLTHFREPGYPDYLKKGGIAASPEWDPDGRSANLRRLSFPEYEYWDVIFQGPCGRQVPRQ